MRKLSFGRFVALIGVTALVGCATPALVQNADDATRAKALAFDVSSDRGRVYFVSGSVKENIFGLKHKYPSNFFVHGQNIGSKNPENVMVFDLRPGQYEFQWGVRSTDPIDKNSVPAPFRAVVPPGGVLVLRGEYSIGAAMVLGLVGSMVSPPRSFLVEGSRDEVVGKVVVVPQTCPPTICLK
jgi:hypothetical protein